MKQYQVTGMSCAACSARVEKAVRAVPGVESCAVSLLTNSMGVEGTADEKAVIRAVEKAGYGAFAKGAGAKSQRTEENDSELKDTETPLLKKRLFTSLVFLLALMYLSMGHMAGLHPPAYLAHDAVGLGMAQMILAGVVLFINRKFFISGFRGLIHRAPNMDTLVAMGSGAAFVYSVCALFSLSHDRAMGSSGAAPHLYFESAAMILTLITVGKMLEARSKGKTTNAIRGLMKLSPKTAVVIRDGQETEIPIEEVRVGDLFIVKPGESIPVDGVIEKGHTAVNESALTGESIPADKQEGDAVSAATINQSGFITCRATRVGEDTTLSQIIRMVSDAAATKAPIAKAADRVSGVFVPVVLFFALCTFILWLLLGKAVSFSLARAISVLVISCPCALGLATPVAIMVGSGVGARSGILFKTAAALEECGKIQIAALDKTGTITKGEPSVTDILPAPGMDAKALLRCACALEKKSEHPLAKAILRRGEAEGVDIPEADDFEALPGNGLTATVEGAAWAGGSLSFVNGLTALPYAAKKQADAFAAEGKTPLFFCADEKWMGLIAVQDPIKPDSREAIQALQNQGIRVVMLTGDNQRTAEAIGKAAGVDEVIAGVLPGEKETVIRTLKYQGKVAMVGDGINDAPALTSADIGIAIGAGADVAIDAAGVVLMKSRLSDVPAAIRLSRKVLANIHENLFWAFLYNTLGIPLAAGAFISLFGWEMNPMFGAAAMSLSSFCVVTNALRLNFIDIRDGRRDRKAKPLRQAETITRKMKIGGMMCEHCESTVKKALESVPGVSRAEASYEKGEALLVLAYPVQDEKLRAAVEKEDYEVLGIE